MSTAVTDLTSFDPVAFHAEELPQLLALGYGALAAVDAHRLGPIAFVTPSGAWTYRPSSDDVGVEDGVSEDARAVVELDDESFAGLALDLDTAPAMFYQQRAAVTRGHPLRFIRWETPLRALFHGRPIYDATAIDLRERDGSPLDPERVLTLDEVRADHEALGHRLATAGFAAVSQVFGPDEVATMLAEAEELRGEARQDDQGSWWGRTSSGESVVTRVLTAGRKQFLGHLHDDPRIRAVVAASGLELHSAKRDEVDSVTVLWKLPDVVEGLVDLPWHRDCGMGGHALNCPTVVMSICLTDGGPEAGELRALPGSHTMGHPFMDGGAEGAPEGVPIRVTAGDLSLHNGDVMHASLPPTSPEGPHRISVLLAFREPTGGHHRGARHYNDAIFRGDDGHVQHLGHTLGTS